MVNLAIPETMDDRLSIGKQGKSISSLIKSNTRRYYFVAIAAAILFTVLTLKPAGQSSFSILSSAGRLSHGSDRCNPADFVFSSRGSTDGGDTFPGDPEVSWLLTTSDETVSTTALDDVFRYRSSRSQVFNTGTLGFVAINLTAIVHDMPDFKWSHRILGLDVTLSQPLPSTESVQVYVIEDERPDQPENAARCRTNVAASGLQVTVECGRPLIDAEHGQYSGLVGRRLFLQATTTLDVEKFDVHVHAPSNYMALLSHIQAGKTLPFRPASPAQEVIPKQFIWMYGLWDEEFRLDGGADSTGHAPVDLNDEILQLLPARYAERMAAWRAMYNSTGGYRHYIWDKYRAERLLYSQYPEFTQIYEAYPRLVMRADLLRLLLVHYYGGFYNDLDVAPGDGAPIDLITRDVKRWGPMPTAIIWGEATQNFGTVCGAEGCELVRGQPASTRLSNFAFAAIPDHPVIRETLRLLYLRSLIIEPNSDDRVLYITGPSLITDAAHFTLAEIKSDLLNAKFTCSDLYRFQTTHFTTRAEADRYVHHQAMGTWRNHQDHD